MHFIKIYCYKDFKTKIYIANFIRIENVKKFVQFLFI